MFKLNFNFKHKVTFEKTISDQAVNNFNRLGGTNCGLQICDAMLGKDLVQVVLPLLMMAKF